MEKLKWALRHYPIAWLTGLLILLACGVTIIMTNSHSLTITANVVNVRSGPGLSYETKRQIVQGTKINVIGHDNDWYKIRLSDDQTGWVASWLIHNTEVGTTTNKVAKVNKSSVPVYEYARTSSDKLGTVSDARNVTVVYQQGSWSQILYKNTVGWIHQGLSLTDQAPTTKSNQTPKTVTTQLSGVKLRKKASTSSAAMQTLKKGTTLTYIKTVKKEWYQVKTKNGQTGYVASWVVSLMGAQDVTTTSATKLSEATIVLDAGHGGNDSGAISGKNTYEKTYTLETVKQIAKDLRKQGARVILTRDTDKYVSLAARPALSNKDKADAFISIHFDSSKTADSLSGVTTYYYNSQKDMKLAKAINTQLKGLPLANKGVQYGDFQVLRQNHRPAVLLECGYINDSNDYKHIKQAAYRREIASKVTTALENYFK
ncbi:N-acetylmuramoyl-L-alanine amidase family protein [Lactobacillus selangorensis]|uniref:N-acetylmuramoyl-L-alanine amidase family protein n=1 Tax=Lactobacillus selangorensis TaxID=81857 RepID=A0A0R2FM00_9LACO|nr:N-acetylmuramoyl-L-alanine amidase [Lactobacillus selangorensis]KRN29536.1 N-acetylmuramoyl-L-alanine amidase family protein [Lactobacillus selangorensis]KRN33934.1 N-acetylmuramoyl-L-alanine amidase family protein [Lactobacillus selangorensis]